MDVVTGTGPSKGDIIMDDKSFDAAKNEGPRKLRDMSKFRGFLFRKLLLNCKYFECRSEERERAMMQDAENTAIPEPGFYLKLLTTSSTA